MRAGRRPACSAPWTGSNSTQAMSPMSGNVILTVRLTVQNIFQRNLAARVGVIDDFRTAIRTPLDQFRFVSRP